MEKNLGECKVLMWSCEIDMCGALGFRPAPSHCSSVPLTFLGAAAAVGTAGAAEVAAAVLGATLAPAHSNQQEQEEVIVRKIPQDPHTAPQLACHPFNNERGKRSSLPQTRRGLSTKSEEGSS